MRLVLASPIGQRNTHTPSQRQAPRLLPELSSRADSWHTLQRPPWAFRKPLPGSHLDSIDPPGPEHLASGTFPSFPGAHLQVSLPQLQSLNKEPFVTTFAPGLLTQRLAFAWPGRKACPNHRTPHPRGYPGGRNLQPRVARPGSQATPRGERCGLVKRAEASAAGRGTPLLTRRSPRAAGRGCGARCGVRDPERCGPSRCYSLRGLGLGGGASLLGWERPAGQGGSEPAQSPPRPTAAGGGPASPGRFHLRAGPRPRAPAATKATGPRPSCSPQPVGGGGAARSVRDCEGGGAGWARDGRHARSAWPLTARRAQTEPRANFPRGAAERSAPAFLSRSPL